MPSLSSIPRSTVAWVLALVLGCLPLWVGVDLPLVDLPQHLHLITALHRLGDTSTLFPAYFAQRAELTPYLLYYYAVSALGWVLPLELANRLFLTAYVAGLPLSLGFLLASLKRPTWPALLAIPFAYGDSLAWGFINYVSALPLAFLTCGLFVRALDDVPRRRAWAGGLAVALVAVLLSHVQVFAWLAVALPWLLVTTPVPEGWRDVRARVPALMGVVPGVVLFIAWVGLRLGAPAEIAPGEPWKAWGPMLSPQNLAFNSFEQNRDQWLPVLANMLPDGADQLAVRVALGLGALAWVAPLLLGRAAPEGWLSRWRMVGLAATALLLYFALPFDIRGYMYYLNTRYAHLSAALLVATAPPLPLPWSHRATWLGVVVAALASWPLARAFAAFSDEAGALRTASAHVPARAKVMGLIFATGSRHVTHPVYLHASTVAARLQGGITNFSFALTPHSPLKYAVAPPPTFPSEWRPDQLRWEGMGQYYDAFVVRGVDPRALFGGLMGSELDVAASVGDFSIVLKRGANP